MHILNKLSEVSVTKKSTNPLDVNLFNIQIFADGADLKSIVELSANPLISGFTTNPTLMRKAEVANYEQFAKEVLTLIKRKPISFEVFSDEFDEMEAQARLIASWADNVFVKIPITNTKGSSSLTLIERLSKEVKLNVTAMTTIEQVKSVVPVLQQGKGGIVSVFAGRIADAGYDPMPTMRACMDLLSVPESSNVKLLWASPREVYNIVQAESIGCHIITVTTDLLKKIPLIGGDLKRVSLDTVKMFYNDAQAAGYKLEVDVFAAC